MCSASTMQRENSIELRVHALSQLFESFDPSPFREKALDPAAHRYILSCAQEFAPNPSICLVVHLPESLREQTDAIVAGIRNHFRLEAETARRELRHQMRIGRLSLFWGFVILASCSAGRSLLSLPSEQLTRFFSEGLLILGWVALWRPIETLLFEHWKARDECRWLERLSRMRIEFAFSSE